MEKIVAAMPVKNEDWILEYTLKTLQTYVDEIVVLDDFSTDDTVRILESTPKVTTIKRRNREIKRQEVKDWNLLTSLALSRGATWILYTDADEVIEKKIVDVIQDLVSQNDVGMYRFKKICAWRSFDKYRVDRPDKFIASPAQVWNPILLKASPEIEWAPPTSFGMDLMKFLLRGERFWHGQYGRGGVRGVKGKTVLLEDVTSIHYNHFDYDRLLTKQFLYAFAELKRNPRIKKDKFMKWVMSNIDEKGLRLETMPKDYLWGWESMIRSSIV